MKASTVRGAARNLILLSTVAVGAMLAAGAQAQTKEPFKVGAIFPLTGIGAPTGASSNIGLKLAIEDVNKAGGILGRTAESIVVDDQFDPTQAVSLAKRLVSNDKVDVVIGPQAGQLALAVMPVLTEANVAYFTAGAPTGVTVAQGPTFFSVQITAEEQAVTLVDWAINVRKAKSLGLLTDNGANGKAMGERFKSYAAEKGVRVVTAEVYEQGSPDMTAQLFSMRRASPEVIAFQSSTVPDSANFLKGVEQINWNVPIAASTTITALYRPIAAAAGPDAIKRVTGAIQIKSFTYCANDPVGTSPYSKMLDRLKAAYPSNYQQIAYSLVAWTYDAVMVAKAAAEGAKSSDGRKMAAWLESNSVPALTGDLKASKTSHFLGSATTATVVEDMGSLRSDGLMKRSGC
jgi:branched-chain amino acid transport system substrate-binding protein